MSRRNSLIGLATIVLGSSGFIFSGAFELGSEGSLGANWVQVAGVNQAVQALGDGDLDVSGTDSPTATATPGTAVDTLTSTATGTPTSVPTDTPTSTPTDTATSTPTDTPTDTPIDTPTDTPEPDTPTDTPEPDTPTDTPEPDTPTDTPEPDTPTDTPEPDTPTDTQTKTAEPPTPTDTPTDTPELPTPYPTKEPEDETPESGQETRVQVVTEPNNDGNLVNKGSLTWNGQMAGSEAVVSDGNGFLDRFTVENANKEAVSLVGFVDGDGYPSGRIAFLVANAGNPKTPGSGGGPVEIDVSLLDGNQNSMGPTDQMNLPYRVVDSGGQVNRNKRGTDLTRDRVELPAGSIIEVVIEIDSRNGIDEAQRVETLVFSARPTG